MIAGYALGNYGLSPLKSIKFNKARWKEMVKPYFEKNDVFTMPQNDDILLNRNEVFEILKDFLNS